MDQIKENKRGRLDIMVSTKIPKQLGPLSTDYQILAVSVGESIPLTICNAYINCEETIQIKNRSNCMK